MYRSIAVATTFSPRFLALLSEARRVAEHFGAPLQLIHAGVQSPEKQTQFLQGLEMVGMPTDTPIHWVPGDPAITISECSRENGVDLLISGAIDKEAGYRPFANDIARSLLASAPADLFLFLKPSQQPIPLMRPAVLVDYSDHSARLLRKMMNFTQRHSCEKLTAINISTTFDEHRLRAAGSDQKPEERLDQFVLQHTKLEVPVETVCIRGNTGFAACEYIQSIDTDLLAVPSGNPGGPDPVFSPTMDWLFQVIPCNLWVMRERPANPAK